MDYQDSDAVEQQARDVDDMHITIQQAQQQVHLGDSLQRLQENPDFQRLIMQDYLKDHTARLGHLLSEPAMQEKQKRKDVIKEIEAVGNFLSYLRVTGQRAAMAKEAIRVNEAELKNIAEEQAA